jgi:hypothetical protein
LLLSTRQFILFEFQSVKKQSALQGALFNDPAGAVLQKITKPWLGMAGSVL